MTDKNSPDNWGSVMDPPYNRRVRRHVASAASTVALWVIVMGAAAGLCWTVYAAFSG